MPKAYGSYCCAYGCMNRQADKTGKSFFTFPKDPERLKSWLQAIDRNDLANSFAKGKINYRVCSDHFKVSDFAYRRLLRESAVPGLTGKSSARPSIDGASSSLKDEVTQTDALSYTDVQKPALQALHGQYKLSSDLLLLRTRQTSAYTGNVTLDALASVLSALCGKGYYKLEDFINDKAAWSWLLCPAQPK